MKDRLKVHLLAPGGRVACNAPSAKLTTRRREEVTCGLCLSVGVRGPVRPRLDRIHTPQP